MKKYMVAVLIGMLLNCAAMSAFALTLEWDRNSETDMKQYHVYVCKVKNCTELAAGLDWIATVPQPVVGVKPSQILPGNVNGGAAVTAEDMAGNISGVSVTIPFSTDLAPGAPVGLLLR